MAIVATALPALFMSEGLGKSARITQRSSDRGPVVTLFLGWGFLGEPLGWLQLGGAALVLSGVLLVSVRKR